MRVIPAIDIIDGKCVRLSQGDYSRQTTYYEDPLEVALKFEGVGISYLHLVDLDGARSSRIINYKVLEKLAIKTALKIDFGGGIKSDEDIRIAFESGANQITAGSIAVKNPEIVLDWLGKYGPDKIILGADARDRKIAVSGWKEESDQELLPFIQEYVEQGVKYIVTTDIARDGMLQGPATELYAEIIAQDRDATPNGAIKLIASGGIRDLRDLEQLAAVGCEGAIVGKAIYEGRIAFEDLPSEII